MEQLTALIDQYIDIDSQIKTLTEQKDTLKEQIVAAGEGTHRGGIGSVSVQLSQRNILSQAKLKEKYGDDIKDCYDVSTSITVRISRY